MVTAMELAWLIPALPLLGFLINGLLAHRLKMSERAVGSLACATVAISLAVSVYVVYQYKTSPYNGLPYVTQGYTWIAGGEGVVGQSISNLQVKWAYQIDGLSSVFILFVTFTGLLIHIFATGYMHKDPGYARFFAYMNLFMFMMLTLVLGSSLLMTFVGWEGVGLCSYLLIGFYHERPEAADAAKKAFVVNRVGDLGFLLAISGCFAVFGTLDYSTLDLLARQRPAEAMWGFGAISLISLGLLIGASGKSAQIPLYVWLPDAMAGPTPVSALIHAATMVTAGVFLFTRMNTLFQDSPTVMLITAVVGALTATVAATIAVTEHDIKKVLAYSTISQLGYMFLACGVGAFTAAVFHVVTHAFFKALLFLGAGSIIYALHHEQDMRRMGGLKTRMKATWKTMLVGWLAICGVFPLSGFWSKDEILSSVFTSQFAAPISMTLFVLGLLTAFVTAFYMTRLMCLTFDGEERFTGTVHEASSVMLTPLWILAVFAMISGAALGLPLGHSLLSSQLYAVVQGSKPHSFGTTELLLATASVAVAVAGILLARRIYRVGPAGDESVKRLGLLYRLAERRWYWDELLDVKFVEWMKRVNETLFGADQHIVDSLPNGSALITRVSSRVSGWVDLNIVDLAVNFTGWMVRAGSVLLRHIQTGAAHNYLLVMALGLFAVLLGVEYGALKQIYQKLASLVSR